MLDHHVALAKGHYRQQGLDVELVAPSGMEAIRSLTTGDVKVSSYSSKVMDAILKEGLAFKFVLFTRNGVPHRIVARPDIRSAKDLKGKTIWTGSRDGTNYYMTLDWLKENGLEPGVDVRLVSYDNPPDGFFASGRVPEWARASLKGACDAAMIQVLETELLEEHFGYHLLVELTDRYANKMIHGLAAHVDTIAREPETIKRLVKAHQSAAKTIKEDREWCTAFIAEKWGLTPRVAEKTWEIMRPRFIAEIDPNWLSPEIEYFRRHIQEHNSGRAIETPNPASLVDGSFV
jgi:ABC-type nitrate/sulfonate/bicarbonate transport system substrate-binding protein